MISTIKFIDANIFIERWGNAAAKELTDNLDPEKHCTSVLVLAEVHHKLSRKGLKNAFGYIRNIMGAIKVHDICQGDLFNAMKNPSPLCINDKMHIEVMKRNGMNTIISFDKGFDKDKTIMRESV
jgi:predicted nucleic acid-binding protein